MISFGSAYGWFWDQYFLYRFVGSSYEDDYIYDESYCDIYSVWILSGFFTLDAFRYAVRRYIFMCFMCGADFSWFLAWDDVLFGYGATMIGGCCEFYVFRIISGFICS